MRSIFSVPQLLFAIALGVLIASPHSLGRTQSVARHVVAASNLRQIAQANLIYAQSHQDHLPAATDIWDYAKLLAADGGLEGARMWQEPLDPANKDTISEKTLVLLPAKPGQPRELNPVFRKIKPSFAVPIGRLHANLPSTTPIAWTRGLQPDGTWAPHSPYGTAGGHIVFIGGNVVFYKNLKGENGQGELINRAGATTANILDALPPGTRIGEYIPTPEEQAAWAKTNRTSPTPASCCISFGVPNWTYIIIIVWAPFIVVSILRLRLQRPGAFTVLGWPLVITVLLSAIIPSI